MTSLLHGHQVSAGRHQPAVGLVTPPPSDRRLGVHTRSPCPPQNATWADVDMRWWLLGAHGGAGVSSLIRCGVGGADAERHWPQHGHVAMVARRTACGLEWARDAARQHAAGCAPGGVILAGLVVIADAPGRCPARLEKFLNLISGAFPHVWEVPWVEEWRLSAHTEVLPMPPAAKHLRRDLQALVGASAP